MKTNQIFLAIIVVAFTLASCGGSKKAPRKVYEAPSGTVSVELPCTGTSYMSDKKHFRATGIQTSAMEAVALKSAVAQSKSQIANDISVRVQNVLQNYNKIIGVENTNTTTQAFEDMTKQVANTVLTGTRTICQKFVRVTEEGPNKGKYKAYVTQEIDVDAVYNEVSSMVSKGDQAKVEYDYEKFKEVFEMEMQKN